MVDIEIKGLEGARKWFDPKNVDRAAKDAINEAAKKARTAADTEIRKTWNMTKQSLKGRLKQVSKATEGKLESIIEAKSRPISLSSFGLTATSGRTKQTRKGVQTLKRASSQQGVSVQILKGKPKTHLPHAFLKRMGGSSETGGNFRVFERMTKRRLPLADRHIITVASMFDRPDVQNSMEQTIEETFNQRFNHHLDRLLDRAGR